MSAVVQMTVMMMTMMMELWVSQGRGVMMVMSTKGREEGSRARPRPSRLVLAARDAQSSAMVDVEELAARQPIRVEGVKSQPCSSLPKPLGCAARFVELEGAHVVVL